MLANIRHLCIIYCNKTVYYGQLSTSSWFFLINMEKSCSATSLAPLPHPFGCMLHGHLHFQTIKTSSPIFSFTIGVMELNSFPENSISYTEES